MAEEYIDIVFTGPPDPDPAQCGFVEVERSDGTSMRLGEWVERGDGYWVLRFKPSDHV
jgi:hypothetical protein